MKSIAGIFLGAVFCFLGTASAVAAPPIAVTQTYVGGGMGGSYFPNASNLLDFSGEPNVTRSAYSDKSLSGQLYGGMRFSNGLALELLYYDYGEITGKTDYVYSSQSVHDEDNISLHGWGGALRYDYELSLKWSTYIRAGIMKWELANKGKRYIYSGGHLVGNDSGSSKLNDSDMFGSLGVDYAFTPAIHFFSEANYVAPRFGYGENFRILSVFAGVEYRFYTSRHSLASAVTNQGSGKDNQTEGADKVDRNRAMTACDPKYKDISGVACE